MHCNGLLGMKMCNFCPKIWIFGAKSQFLGLEPHFLSTGHITSKLGPDFNFLKILTMTEEYWVLARIDGETTDFPKKENGQNFHLIGPKKVLWKQPQLF